MEAAGMQLPGRRKERAGQRGKGEREGEAGPAQASPLLAKEPLCPHCLSPLPHPHLHCPQYTPPLPLSPRLPPPLQLSSPPSFPPAMSSFPPSTCSWRQSQFQNASLLLSHQDATTLLLLPATLSLAVRNHYTLGSDDIIANDDAIWQTKSVFFWGGEGIPLPQILYISLSWIVEKQDWEERMENVTANSFLGVE